MVDCEVRLCCLRCSGSEGYVAASGAATRAGAGLIGECFGYSIVHGSKIVGEADCSPAFGLVLDRGYGKVGCVDQEEQGQDYLGSYVQWSPPVKYTDGLL